MKYDDIYMRDFPGDVGDIPSTNTEDVSVSPDIIPVGTRALSDPGVLVRKYGGPFDDHRNVDQLNRNLIYVRARNLATKAESGKIRLYFCQAALSLHPKNWLNNVIRSANDADHVTLSKMAPDGIAVGGAPFQWKPDKPKPEYGHYCLIAQVITDRRPNHIDPNMQLKDFAKWAASHPGIAFRNVELVTELDSPSYSRSVQVLNSSPDTKDYALVVTFKNLPETTLAELLIVGEGSAPPFLKVEKELRELEKTSDPKTVRFSRVLTLPPWFDRQLHLTLRLPKGMKWPDGGKVCLKECLADEATEDMAAFALPNPERLLGASAESLAGRNLFLLGGYTIQFQVNG